VYLQTSLSKAIESVDAAGYGYGEVTGYQGAPQAEPIMPPKHLSSPSTKPYLEQTRNTNSADKVLDPSRPHPALQRSSRAFALASPRPRSPLRTNTLSARLGATDTL
jgi:hypothetical protein